MAFEQHGLAQPGSQEDDSGQRGVRDVTLLLQAADYVGRIVDVLARRKRWWHGVVGHFFCLSALSGSDSGFAPPVRVAFNAEKATPTALIGLGSAASPSIP